MYMLYYSFIINKMHPIFITSLVTLVCFVLFLIWSVNGTSTLSKLESIISKVGRSYEEVGTSKDVRIKELQDQLADYEQLRTDLIGKRNIIVHMESRIASHTRETEQSHRDYIEKIDELETLTTSAQSRDDEAERYKDEIAGLELSIKNLQKDNTAMYRKLDLFKQTLD